jgi:putative pyruvate formate lyase activating enzyme
MSGPAAYQDLYLRGELAARAEQAREILKNCQLCPRHCNVNRLAGKLGACSTGAKAVVYSYAPHFGEETPLVGKYGSGTIFFANCNLKCVFCQNYQISQMGEGREVTGQELAMIMLSLQERGCHNINLVTPTHVVPQILQALERAVAEGLSIPLVYNCGGYESVETLKLLKGIIDIYMPDMKYSDEKIAQEYSGIENYPSVNKAAIKEMYRQVGDLQIDELGIATRGLLVRHLVLPQGLAGTASVVHFLAEEVSPNTYFNIMAQYRPFYKASQFPSINKALTRTEFSEAVNIARQQGLGHLDGIYPPREERFIASYE